MAIQFFVEDVDPVKFTKKNMIAWLRQVISKYDKKVGNINYIFCSDEYLRNINIEYLKHDYYTDIITFNYTEKSTINSDIYISFDRVHENSLEFKVDFGVELKRVMVHGILHLVGLNDETESDKMKMRLAEDECLALSSIILF